eukprot:scaffold272407_cov37-Tisochrysis_lutea.AAC.2
MPCCSSILLLRGSPILTDANTMELALSSVPRSLEVSTSRAATAWQRETSTRRGGLLFMTRCADSRPAIGQIFEAISSNIRVPEFHRAMSTSDAVSAAPW